MVNYTTNSSEHKRYLILLAYNSSADWCDENTRIVCELFAAEVMIGNRDNTHLNKAGYKNVIEKFKQRTGIEYSRKQFKNKWDRLKTDYVIWKKLTNKETGIGWDAAHTNIVMSEAWWKKTAKVSATLPVHFWPLFRH